MTEKLIVTGTVTYAIKGRELLRKRGYKAYVERITASSPELGCGYAIVVSAQGSAAENILRNAGIKILEIIER